jgi:chemotaxis protein MotB
LRVELIESERHVLRLRQLAPERPWQRHTDARPYASRGDYSNWELSADRANAARRLMEASGLALGRVVQVRGFADRNLRDKQHPEDASNRRISVIVRYQQATEEEPADGEGPR